MTTPQVQNDSIVVLNPFLYKNGLIISNDGTTPNTVLNISAGQCRDSNNTIDMGIGTLYPPDEGQGLSVAAPLSLNAAVNGANGLDTGSLGASHVYAVYMIGDSRYYKPVASLLSLASNATPLLPSGYDSYRIIGYMTTDGSSHFLAGYYAGSGNALSFTYDAPQATSISAGAATTYTGVDLTNFVPPLNNLPVVIAADLIPGNAAGDTLKLQGYNSTGDAVTITGQVTTVHVTENVTVLAQLNTAAPSIKYKVTNAGDTAVLKVAGYNLSV